MWSNKGAAILILLQLLSATEAKSSVANGAAKKKLVYIGGYSNKIVLASLQQGNLQATASFASAASATFLAIHPNGRSIYATNQQENGTLQSFSIKSKSGFLTFLNQVSSQGSSPAHISVHPSGKWLLFANYKGHNFGSIAIFPNGSLAPFPISLIMAHGHGPNTDRQEAPHPHQIITDPSGKFAFVSDLGTDKIYQLTVSSTGELAPNPYAKEVNVVPAGSGPRHLIFKLPFVYGINELANSVTLYSFDQKLGTLELMKSWSTLDGSVTNSSLCTAAELAVSEDGKFLYASNRCGQAGSSLAVFSIAPKSGELVQIGARKFVESVPRHFALDKDPETVVVAFQSNNGSVGVYRRNSITGQVDSQISYLYGFKSPTCVAILP